ncbi:peptide chain release factor 1- mitochondrial [Brachionus plicatilis]|uniref:Peptide chain release factor 1-mitochondrial n=1 Tax=Brachionus plicatilis TaxID=10195 RepID=A0A3M7SNR6_BRAPC|nr:peptide chain release factor 1- mitochondrial [Brachionus plicatilis]
MIFHRSFLSSKVLFLSKNEQKFCKLFKTTPKSATNLKFKRNYVSEINLLETTTKKIINCYDDSHDYIKSLIDERKKLTELLNNDKDFNTNKLELFQHLNYLTNLSTLYDQVNSNTNEFLELQEMLIQENDEMAKMIQNDLIRLDDQIFEDKNKILQSLIPRENEDKEDAIMELSAGVGGQESRIFCSELFEMYKSYANIKNWSFSPVKIDTDITEWGELMRQAKIEISGISVFEYLKFESGVHRVQRVPRTESKGRIHTSTVGVVVSPKPSEIKIELNPKELKIETKTSGGPGGQHANKIESAVRILHIPSGIVVYNDEERQMHQNKSRALENLKQKLYQKAFEEELDKRQTNRKMQIGSSSRSERIRTYNFIQDRITDHRLDENFVGIQRFLAAETLNDVIESLKAEQQVELIYELVEKFNKKSKK